MDPPLILSSKGRFLLIDISCTMTIQQYIIISKDKPMYGQPILSATITSGRIYNTPVLRKVAKVYLWNAIVTKHLALTIWHPSKQGTKN